MSAFIVDREDIHVIVTAARNAGLCKHYGLPSPVGRMLWAENVRSVAYRYPNDKNGDRPGPLGFRDEDVRRYAWKPIANENGSLRAALKCYRYQSCEHPEWEDSQACELTALLLESCDE